MKRLFVWIALISALIVGILAASTLQPTKAPSPLDGEYIAAMAALKPLLQDLEMKQSTKDRGSVQSLSGEQRQEIIKASEGLISDVQVSRDGVVVVEIRSKQNGKASNTRFRLISDKSAGVGWTCEGLSEGELPPSCRRVKQ